MVDCNRIYFKENHFLIRFPVVRLELCQTSLSLSLSVANVDRPQERSEIRGQISPQVMDIPLTFISKLM